MIVRFGKNPLVLGRLPWYQDIRGNRHKTKRYILVGAGIAVVVGGIGYFVNKTFKKKIT